MGDGGTSVLDGTKNGKLFSSRYLGTLGKAADVTWRQRRGEFREGAYQQLKLKTLEARFSTKRRLKRKAQVMELPSHRRPREVMREPMLWSS